LASVGHIAVGLVAAKLYRQRAPGAPRLARSPIVWCALAMVVDLDVIAFKMGVPYHHPWGHRGASHALLFAVGLALLCGGLWRARGQSFRLAFPLALLAIGSHGPLDALTDGGLGSALLWPFTDARYFFPWTPLPVAPIGAAILSPRGARVLATEAVWFAPLLLWALWPDRSGAIPRAANR
jgi:inner membrane protein